MATQGHQLFTDPQLVARGFWETVDHPEAGRHAYLSRPFQLSKTPGESYRSAPLLGEHTDEILREVAGMTDAEVRELADLGVTSNDPTAFVLVDV